MSGTDIVSYIPSDKTSVSKYTNQGETTITSVNADNEMVKMVGLFVASKLAPQLTYGLSSLLKKANFETLGDIVKITIPVIVDAWRFMNNNLHPNLRSIQNIDILEKRIKALEDLQ